ncbi:hypothetical protein KL912_002338 [Ogataea haglerorum]|nr:hypothetical protein KL951_000758 [Ogataea haglerorum]KAG7748433.1 hypothetical protein KL912_002338 [Ogataea haglerorum]KAG7791583.1 hypothetical protein KL910_001709 [Ogataea haglerorum]KAG7792328.1 hypothetical protein KL945_000609 [Ogataea haglerorum]KAG7803379.1 hypothetical protein KL944_001332 [Ogataea haglerorum]
MTRSYPLDYTSKADTYYLASKVKAKLTREAVKNDINLHRLVCQANLLDNLIDKLNAAEESKGRTVSFDNIASEKRVQLVEPVKPELTNPQQYDDDFYSDSDSDPDEDYEYDEVSKHQSSSLYMNHEPNGSTVTITTECVDSDEEDDMPSLSSCSSESESDYDSDEEADQVHVQHVEHADRAKIEAARNLLNLRRNIVECI